MPSPLLHSCAGAALSSAGSSRQHRVALAAALVVAANAPDLDLIPGLLVGDAGRYHHGIAHSLGAAVFVGGLAAVLARWLRMADAARFGLLAALAFASHLVLDMLATGKSVHNAVPLLWPLSNTLMTLPLSLFPDIEYDLRSEHFIGSLASWRNAYAVMVELVFAAAIYAVIKVVTAGVRGGSGRQAGPEQPLRPKGRDLEPT